jgi:hypothetical protein
MYTCPCIHEEAQLYNLPALKTHSINSYKVSVRLYKPDAARYAQSSNPTNVRPNDNLSCQGLM